MKNRMEGIGARAQALATLGIAAFVAAAVRIPPASAKKLSELAEAGADDIQDSLGLVTWVFYGLSVFVAGWAVLKFKAHVENPQRGGLAQPVVGILVAIALAATPALIDAGVETFDLDADPVLQKPRFQ